jgi:hypothetical protein
MPDRRFERTPVQFSRRRRTGHLVSVTLIVGSRPELCCVRCEDCLYFVASIPEWEAHDLCRAHQQETANVPLEPQPGSRGGNR